MEFTPATIVTTEQQNTKAIVTAEHWNELFNLLITQGNNVNEGLFNLITELASVTGTTLIKTSADITLQAALDTLVTFANAGVKFLRLNVDNVIETSADGIEWQASGSSGHAIYNSAGQLMDQRNRLKFLNCTLSDDGTYTIIQGLQGPKGDTGATGATGVQGIQGIQGPVGYSIVPSVDQNTGLMTFAIGSAGVVPAGVNVRGPQGPQGVQGLQGSIGPKGEQGIQGPTGIAGEQGPRGLTGAQGIQGERGTQGIQGVQGPQGIDGPVGPKGDTGAQGPSGATGAQGPQGPQGIQGVRGTDGTSFAIKGLYATLLALQTTHPTGAAGDAYAVGTSINNIIYNWDVAQANWVSLGSLQGPQGPQGIQGIAGNNGAVGPTGPQGATGAQGEQGPQGIQGPQGPQGETGATGATGAQGVAGATGAQGIQGVQGVAGPNLVGATTSTDITGMLKGNGSTVAQAVAGTDYQAPTQGLTVETVLADADVIAFYDASATAHRKSTWANIKSLLKAVNDLLYAPMGHNHAKANITDFPTSMPPTAHKSTHSVGGADALIDADIGLTPAVATALGLTGNPQVGDALAALGRFHAGLGNDYIWSKNTTTPDYTATVTESITLIGQNANRTVYYSDGFSVSLSGEFVLENPQSIAFPNNTSVQSVLSGKYVQTATLGKRIAYIPSNAVFTVNTQYNYVSISTGTMYTNPKLIYTVVGYVNSSSPTAYPPSTPDGYAYISLGKIGERARIATGSYVGTGTYGSTNPNSLTFDFVPKALSICMYQPSSNRVFYGHEYFFPSISLDWITITYREIYMYASVGTYSYYVKKSADGKTIYWYSDSNTNQLSDSACQYYYYAIG